MRGKKILASIMAVGLFITNIPVSIVASALSISFSRISFEENEDISFVKAETGTTIETTGFGPTHGTRALSTTVTYKSNQESTGIVIDKEGTWDFGDNSVITSYSIHYTKLYELLLVRLGRHLWLRKF